MNGKLSRKQFLGIATLGTSGIALNAFKATAQTPPEKPPPLRQELVKEYVIAGHGNLEKTKTMLEAEPALLNACWDWGGGDFETALEGAGHTGSRDVALYL